jgi:hypothetical protein
VLEATECPALNGCPPVEFLCGVFRDLVRVALTASRNHFMAGKPGTQIPELNEPRAVGPPEKAELLDGQKNKSSGGLSSREFRIWSCHVASLMVCRRTENRRPLFP